jgi:SAM-dependent methyltransferase
MSNHSELYEHAKYYDIAFDFRDIPKECDFLQDVFTDFTGRLPDSVLELGAGPAYHTIEFSKRGVAATALDISPAMVQYGKEKAEAADTVIKYECGDMTDFECDERFDMVVMLMNSGAYLLDNEAVYRNFECVANVLNDGGLYIIEIDHPRDIFGIKDATLPSWTMTRGITEVYTAWGDPEDHFDPITQITDVSVTLKYKDGGRTGEIHDKGKNRNFTANEIKALVDASRRFELVTFYGAMDKAVPFNNHRKAWRMIPVLKLAG